jgi:hypothetical protein
MDRRRCGESKIQGRFGHLERLGNGMAGPFECSEMVSTLSLKLRQLFLLSMEFGTAIFYNFHSPQLGS